MNNELKIEMYKYSQYYKHIIQLSAAASYHSLAAPSPDETSSKHSSFASFSAFVCSTV
jgi:hypothetical protein